MVRTLPILDVLMVVGGWRELGNAAQRPSSIWHIARHYQNISGFGHCYEQAFSTLAVPPFGFLTVSLSPRSMSLCIRNSDEIWSARTPACQKP